MHASHIAFCGKDRIIRKLGLRRHSYHESADLKTRSEGMDWVLQVTRPDSSKCVAAAECFDALRLEAGTYRGRSLPPGSRMSTSFACWMMPGLGSLELPAARTFSHRRCQASIDASGRVGLFDVLDADAGGELSVDEPRGSMRQLEPSSRLSRQELLFALRLVTGLMSLRGPVTKGDATCHRKHARANPTLPQHRVQWV